MKPLVLRDFNFFKLWSSQVISQMGNRMFQIAILWWMIQNFKGETFEISSHTFTIGEGTLVSLFLILGILPSILLVKVIGKIIAEKPAKKILLTSDILGFILSLLLYSFFYFKISSFSILILLFIASFFFSLFQGLISPTLNKSIPDLVPGHDLEKAVAFVASTDNLANFAGAMMGALLINSLGVANVILLNGLTYFVSAFCDGTLIFRFSKGKIPETSLSDNAIQSPSKKKKSYLFFEKVPLLKNILWGFSIANFFLMPIQLILPLYTKHVLNGDASLLSLLEAFMWMGLITGTFSSPHLPLKEKSLLSVAVSILISGISFLLPGLPVISSLVVAMSLFGAGMAIGLLNARILTYFQKVVPHQEKGHFFALLQAIVSFVVPLSYFTFGFMADKVQLKELFLLQGLALVILSFYYFHLSKRELVYEI